MPQADISGSSRTVSADHIQAMLSQIQQTDDPTVTLSDLVFVGDADMIAKLPSGLRTEVVSDMDNNELRVRIDKCHHVK